MKENTHPELRHGAAFMPEILARIAPVLGARVVLEPEFGVVGQIEFKNGRKSYFWHNKFNLNSVSSAKIAQDKAYTSFFLEQFGYSVPQTQTFFSDRFLKHIDSNRNVAAACAFAERIGWPVIVKPCRRSQGAAVNLVYDKDSFWSSAERVFQIDRTLLVQAYCPGRDYRIVTLDGDAISAYERVPLRVTGDGHSTISSLLSQLQDNFRSQGRDTVINVEDPRIGDTLRRNRLTVNSVIAAKETVSLLPVANLSCGGTTIDITECLHPSVAALAGKIADDMDLRFAGIDIVTGDATQPLGQYTVLEVNSAPGLDHYGGSGEAHQELVDSLYLKVLRAIEKGAG
ncbi:MAG: cyanophycin synthetase [Candidatus Hydrogenedentes bacterium]|nr:cyanophycin synthetase [Candidatus Hydrogenedentota bacterium]